MSPDADRPYAMLAEREPERDARGNVTPVDVSTVFLTVSACPVGCSMCDLHRFTLPHPTPPGAVPRQIEVAQQQLPPAAWIKLYNAGNFFDPRSIPPSDHAAVLQRCSGYRRVIVENHPRFGRDRHRRLRALIPGQLEIAVGLESVQPRLLDRLGKRMTRDDFDDYAAFLKRVGIDLRVFLIVGAPALTVTESIRWTRLSVRHAVAAGARHISLIPARPGHGWQGQASLLPTLSVDALAEVYALSLRDADRAACIAVDLWDVPPEENRQANEDPPTRPSAERQRCLTRFADAILRQQPL